MPYKAKNKNSFSALGEIVLEAQNLTKSFSLYSHPLDRLKEALLGAKNIQFIPRLKTSVFPYGQKRHWESLEETAQEKVAF